MKHLIKTIIMLLGANCLTLSSCKKSDDATVPAINTPQEQITTVIIKGYNHSNPNDSTHFINVKWEDLDGSGGKAPGIDSLLLDTSITYDIQLLLLDKTKTPYDTVSNEVKERGNMHQFFYLPSSTLTDKVFIERLDKDNNNPSLPIGLNTSWNIRSIPGYPLPVSGEVRIILSHYDGIPKTVAPSPESDMDITFPVRLKQ